MHLLLSFLFSVFISMVSLKARMLNLKGAIATFCLAFIIFYFGDVKWTIPILTFFILSSLLSKIRKKINPKVDSHFQKSDERDHIQVMANGGFPGMLILMNQFFASELFYIAYVSAIAVVCSDTWATEIGTFFSTKTFNIINLNPVEQGISGGVSVIGLFGSILGSIVIAISAFPWISNYEFAIIIIASGLLGNTFDSVLGSTLQSKFSCVDCKKIIEKKHHCGTSTIHSKGLKWLDNDGVNFAASTFGGATSILLTSLII
jgi:uncharacterized protein (TIGR00297 family)